MKKIALIQSNSPFLIDEKVFPNIGLVRVGTQLKNEGHKTDIYDFSGMKQEEITNKIKSIAFNYDFYGFSSTTPQFPYVMKIFNALKEKNPKAKTVIGGAHSSALYNLKQKNKEDTNIDDLEQFDTIFAGEGEETSKIFKEGWQKSNIIRNIDDVSIPDRDMIDIQSYEYKLLEKLTTSMQTQRGCPHQCAFCSGRDIDMYNKVRMHSPKRVLKELDDLNKKYGYVSFMMYDDEINLNVNRLEELCLELSKKPYQFRAFVRSDNIVRYPQSVEQMKKAGFVKLCVGVESGSNRILKLIDKKSTVEMNTEARKIIKDNKIHYESFLLMGHPSETLDEVMMTYNWIKDNKPDDFDLNVITIYPGSKMYDDGVLSQKFKNYNWNWNGIYFNKSRFSTTDSYYKGLNAQSMSDTRTDELTHNKLHELRNMLDKKLKRGLKK